MITWLFSGVWHAVVGLLLLLVVFGGAAILLLHGIVKGAEHDQVSCQCPDCKRRRVDALRKAQQKLRQDQRFWPKGSSSEENWNWLTTIELLPTDCVEIKDVTYEVTEVELRTGSYYVYLRPPGRKTSSVVRISAQNATKKMWKRAKRWN